ncbi:unnamed protein product, partial [Ectocarpus sp. 12 AP-2014]
FFCRVSLLAWRQFLGGRCRLSDEASRKYMNFFLRLTLLCLLCPCLGYQALYISGEARPKEEQVRAFFGHHVFEFYNCPLVGSLCALCIYRFVRVARYNSNTLRCSGWSKRRKCCERRFEVKTRRKKKTTTNDVK